MASVAVIKMAEESPNSHRSVSPTEETPSVPPSSSSGRRSGTKKKKASHLEVFQLHCQRHNLATQDMAVNMASGRGLSENSQSC